MSEWEQWEQLDAWPVMVRDLEASVTRELALALAWSRVVRLRDEVAAALLDAEQRQSDAAQRLPELARIEGAAQAGVTRAARDYEVATSRSVSGVRYDSLPETRKLHEAGERFRAAAVAHDKVAAALALATGDIERLLRIQRNLDRVGRPDCALLAELRLTRDAEPVSNGRKRRR